MTSRKGCATSIHAPLPVLLTTQGFERRGPDSRAISLDGQPTPRIASGASPMRTRYSAERRVLGKWKCASLLMACRALSSMDPETSPPCTWAMQRFM